MYTIDFWLLYTLRERFGLVTEMTENFFLAMFEKLEITNCDLKFFKHYSFIRKIITP